MDWQVIIDNLGKPVMKAEIEMNCIVGLEDIICRLESRIDFLEERIRVLENPKSDWVANSKGGV